MAVGRVGESHPSPKEDSPSWMARAIQSPKGKGEASGRDLRLLPDPA